MKDPVPGTFRVTDCYDAHPHESSSRPRLTGVVTAPGIPATAGEHDSDMRGRWAIGDELPALVDRADPSRFVILWHDVKQPNINDRLKQDAQTAAQVQADLLNAQQQRAPQPGQPGQPGHWTPGWGLPTAPHGGFNAVEAAQFLASGAGERAGAVVTSATDVPAQPGNFLPAGGQADIALEITRSDGSFYTATTRVAFSTPERRASIATPGTRLQVRIDPANPSRLVIDTTGQH